MLRGWVKDKKAALSASGSTHSLNSAAELQNLEEAMKAASHIMNDDLESAEAALKEGASSFHKLGKGVVTFLRATLGFEPEIMREASERLADAEATASNDYRRAQKEPRSHHSSIYPPGSEFGLCLAQSQLMSAVVGVLNENLMESIRGFYKLRKAYVTLDGILEAERNYIRSKEGMSNLSTRKLSFDSVRTNESTQSGKAMPGGFGDRASKELVSKPVLPSYDAQEVEKSSDHEANDDSDGEFVDAEETHDEASTTARYLGHIDVNGVTKDLSEISINTPKTPNSPYPKTPTTPFSPRSPTKTTDYMLELDPDAGVFSDPIDTFIHSGANLCFGLLSLMLSLVPPAFSKLLFIIGFKGDRQRGIRMLWQSCKFHNINGAMSGLILLGYYNGLVSFCDILPDSKPVSDSTSSVSENLAGYPTHRLEELLAQMRTRYPKSRLWLLEESRMQASKKRLDAAIDLLSTSGKSPLKQVEALSMFEKSLNCMYSHRYSLCAESFVRCTELNNWSHALYFYIAGSAHVELYRRALDSTDPTTAATHALTATSLLQKVRENAGKKKFMARQLPFDVFVVRKLNKWEARAKEWDVPFIDAIGSSPLEEMIYFWNGHKRMDEKQLHQSLEALAWSTDANRNPHWHKEGLDEMAILAVLKAAIYRGLARYEEARALLEKEVLCHDRALFKGNLKDDWTCPTAHYEMGANLWLGRSRAEISGELGGTGGYGSDGEQDVLIELQKDREKVKEAQGWLDKAGKWEAYELDTRIGLKITTGLETLKGWRREFDAP